VPRFDSFLVPLSSSHLYDFPRRRGAPHPPALAVRASMPGRGIQPAGDPRRCAPDRLPSFPL